MQWLRDPATFARIYTLTSRNCRRDRVPGASIRNTALRLREASGCEDGPLRWLEAPVLQWGGSTNKKSHI